jgi:hypothetical protein
LHFANPAIDLYNSVSPVSPMSEDRVFGLFRRPTDLTFTSAFPDASSRRMSSRNRFPRRVMAAASSLDAGWRFHRGDVTGSEAPGLADAGWRALDLPHDWSVEDEGITGAHDWTKSIVRPRVFGRQRQRFDFISKK